jgi:hypothetical protein
MAANLFIFDRQLILPKPTISYSKVLGKVFFLRKQKNN